MTDRDKLIELSKPYVSGSACEQESGACELTKCRSCNARNFADHLTANGVLVPPCKIGDTVYTKGHGNSKHPKEWKVVGFWISADSKCSYMHIHWYKDKDNFATRRVDFNLIGKTVFLAKEDMEQATKEG